MKPRLLSDEVLRALVAEAGCVLAEVRAVKNVAGVPYVLLDAGFHVLCRPMMYGAFHAISIVGKEHMPRRATMVAGPLGEAADVFTQDTGAYGASMASNYNSMPIAPEVFVECGTTRLVRPRQFHQTLLEAERALLEGVWR